MKNELENVAPHQHHRPEGGPEDDMGIDRRLTLRESRHFHAKKDPAGAQVKEKYDKVLNVSLRHQLNKCRLHIEFHDPKIPSVNISFAATV